MRGDHLDVAPPCWQALHGFVRVLAIKLYGDGLFHWVHDHQLQQHIYEEEEVDSTV